jgi:hypothetical protein
VLLFSATLTLLGLMAPLAPALVLTVKLTVPPPLLPPPPQATRLMLKIIRNVILPSAFSRWLVILLAPSF